MSSPLELGLKGIDVERVAQVADAILGPSGGPYHRAEEADQVVSQEEIADRFPGVDGIAAAVFIRSFPNVEQALPEVREQFPDLTDGEIIGIIVLQAYSAVLSHYAITDSLRNAVEGS